jgi:2-oxoacid:acceptor oxidoreductase gamma subunit (pyruvate/2-ketoisovalerate family)
MRRIRFHGRGSQGMKTASRIIGTAAFWEGHQAQDSPVYGAERRGAPMVAFTRITDEPILELGLIAIPDIVVVADETLLDDPQVRPPQGLTTAGTVPMSGAWEAKTSAAPNSTRSWMTCNAVPPRLLYTDREEAQMATFLQIAGKLDAA